MNVKKLVVSAAITGTAGSKAMSPHIPITAEEIAAEAVAVAKAGASMVHIHVHDDTGAPTMETKYFKDAFEAVKEATEKAGVDIIVNLTTSGGSNDTFLRTEHLRQLRPEVCSYDAGTFNWNLGGVFENSPAFLIECGKVIQQLDVKPEIEVFDYGMLGNAIAYAKHGLLKTPAHVQFVLGVTGAMDGTVENLEYLHRHLPEGWTWSVTGIGAAHLPMLLTGLALGADGVRVGLEDNLYLSRGVKATNVQLVERAVAIARMVGREPATAEEARQMLGITRHALADYQK
jgi:uncharacterized protein (DUF849 family)